MQALLPILYALFFILLIYKMKFFVFSQLSFKTITCIFLLKIGAGISLFLIYTHHYSGGDMNAFFEDGNKLFNLLINDSQHFKHILLNGDALSELKTWNASFEETLYNDSRTMVLLNLVFRFFSFGNFYVHIIFMCFLSLIGLIGIYRTFQGYFKGSTKLLFCILFLLPSVLFWSSGVLKEGLVFFGLGMLLYSTNCGLATQYNSRTISLMGLSIGLLLVIKFYIFLALLPGLLANFWIAHSSNRFTFLKYSCSVFVFLFFTALLSLIKPAYNPIKLIVNKQAKSEGVAQGGVFALNNHFFVRIGYNQRDQLLIPANSNTFKIKLNSSYDQWEIKNLKGPVRIVNSTDTSLFKLVYTVVPPNYSMAPLKLQPTISSLLINTPIAIYRTLTTPIEFSTNNWLQLLASLENIVYLFSILLMIVCFKIPDRNNPMLYFCLIFTIIIFMLAGLTTPIIGALLRYRTPVLPFMMIFIFMLTDKNKLKKIPFFGKHLID